MLAPMIRETPAAIEKNAKREERSRMRGRGDKGTLQHEPGESSLYKAGWVLKQKGR
jgi:hypothetical protein